MNTMVTTTIACFLAWIVPGGGHFYLRRWWRGTVFLAVILTLFLAGLSMHGRLFGLESGFFGLLRFVADCAIGLPYLAGRFMEWGSGDIRAFGYEYGNTFLYTAGLLNMLLIVDAFDIAQGRKK